MASSLPTTPPPPPEAVAAVAAVVAAVSPAREKSNAAVASERATNCFGLPLFLSTDGGYLRDAVGLECGFVEGGLFYTWALLPPCKPDCRWFSAYGFSGRQVGPGEQAGLEGSGRQICSDMAHSGTKGRIRWRLTQHCYCSLTWKCQQQRTETLGKKSTKDRNIMHR